MKPSLLIIPAALLGLAVACASDSDSNVALDSGGGTSSGGSSGSGSHIPTVTAHAGSGGSAAQGGAAIAGEGGAFGAPNDGGAGGSAGLQQGTVVVVTKSTCSETGNWTGAAPVAGVSTDSDEKLLTITADELDIVFGRGLSLFQAHRATTSDAFDPGTEMTLPDGYSWAGGAALSADGTTLVIVQTDGLGFAALTRDSRSAEFGASADPTAFIALNNRALQTQEHFGAPVLAPAGKSLIFAAYSLAPGSVARVYESLFVGQAWAMPDDIGADIFDGTTEKRALPTGLSSDSRTLFYYDEATSKQAARFRDRPDAPLYTVVDLGDRDGAVPNSTCQRIYYTSNGDIVVASH